jgi:hypothetical protein
MCSILHRQGLCALVIFISNQNRLGLVVQIGFPHKKWVRNISLCATAAQARVRLAEEVPMRLTPYRPFRSIHSTHSTTRLVRGRILPRLRSVLSRKVIGIAVVFTLVMLPALGLAQKASLLSSLSMAGPIRVVSGLFNMIFGVQEPPPDDASVRTAQVRTIRLSPSRFVGYPGELVTFQAIGTNFAGETVQGVAFDNWESSDSALVQADDSGRARFLRPGLTTITCRAGAAVAVARVLVRPGRRPRQTDQEWKTDQDSLTDTESGGISLLPSLLDKIAPTAYAQGGGYAGTDFGYDELWSQPSNLVGSPRNRAIEPTGLGPVLPEGSNFNFAVPLIGLGGRGIGANLKLYYNSRVWSTHGSAMTFSAGGRLSIRRILYRIRAHSHLWTIIEYQACAD